MPHLTFTILGFAFLITACHLTTGQTNQYTSTGSPTVPPVTCAPGIPICLPLIDPCDPRANNTCPNFPNAQCRSSLCGGCFALWYVNGQDVTQQCRGNATITTNAPPTGCPPENNCPMGVPGVQCFVEPCAGKTCPKNAYAKCCNNYCGGCNAYFYANGVNVTGSC
ncbi:uncharacterized protein LOC129589926 [Paramacrobiotus metropolitanus]|uniref:uncharacterized protein LOC129589926 n=1 Tax=Paramacrobiotus metropolitanus TaxID=2943436 RepID=UPI002445B054|nr:uncharacterized protein LOC129589926 [Paramacrobiotus metropolitanus]